MEKLNGSTPEMEATERGEEETTSPLAGLEAKPRKRRNPSWTEKMRLLREYEALGRGEKGLFMRREGLYSSSISNWRKQRDEKLETSSKRGRKPKVENPLAKELAERDRKIRKLENRNVMLEKVIEVQKKISELTGIPLKPMDIDEDD